MGRSYQGQSSKNKYSNFNHSQDQYKSQMPPVSVVRYFIFEFFILIYIHLSYIFYKQSTTPNKTDTAVRSTKPGFVNATTNTTSDIEPLLETASSSKSNEAYNQSSSSTTINSDVSDNAAGSQNDSISEGSSTTDQSSTTTGTTVNTSTAIPENKTKDENIVPTASKNQSTLPTNYPQPTNSQQTQCSETTVQSTTYQGPENESNKTIDLSSLSAELQDGNLVEEKSNSDCKPQSTSIILIQLIIIKLTVCYKY